MTIIQMDTWRHANVNTHYCSIDVYVSEDSKTYVNKTLWLNNSTNYTVRREVFVQEMNFINDNFFLNILSPHLYHYFFDRAYSDITN